MKIHNQLWKVVIVLLLLMSSLEALAFYNPQTGRWLNRDRIGTADGPSDYGFVRNVPSQSIDLLGLYRRLTTAWRYGTMEEFEGRRQIGLGTGHNGATSARIRIQDPQIDIAVTLGGSGNCKCKLTSVNLTAEIIVFIPLPGDYIYDLSSIGIPATGLQTQNVQAHEAGHVFATQRLYDTLGPKLESDCTGKYLIEQGGWTADECHRSWVQTINAEGAWIVGEVSNKNKYWHDYLGGNAENADYTITTQQFLYWAKHIENYLRYAIGHVFCVGLN